ncbi:MAG: GNAT family N-acetyltransferase [Candidatus Odinarchaeota archaeon]
MNSEITDRRIVEMIKGTTINLRVIERSDLEQLRSWWNNPELRGMEDVFLPVTVPQMEKKYSDWLEQKDALHLVIEKIDGSRLLGKCTIYTGYAGVDLLLAEKDSEPEKTALESLELVKSYLFLEGRGYNNMAMWIPSWNEWLLAIAGKSGMRLAGRVRRTGMREGKYHDTVVYDLLKEEYMASKRT